jgi:hypothetical protein
MGKNKDNKGRQQGATDHAPSQHGGKTLSRVAEMSQTSSPDRSQAAGPQHDPSAIRAHDDTGRDRLFENRQQHDEAEKNSEKTRLARDIDRHDHGPDTEPHHRDTQSASKRKN